MITAITLCPPLFEPGLHGLGESKWVKASQFYAQTMGISTKQPRDSVGEHSNIICGFWRCSRRYEGTMKNNQPWQDVGSSSTTATSKNEPGELLWHAGIVVTVVSGEDQTRHDGIANRSSLWNQFPCRHHFAFDLSIHQLLSTGDQVYKQHAQKQQIWVSGHGITHKKDGVPHWIPIAQKSQPQVWKTLSLHPGEHLEHHARFLHAQNWGCDLATTQWVKQRPEMSIA